MTGTKELVSKLGTAFFNGVKLTMGCSPSRKPTENRTTLQPDLYVTERQSQLVKYSWDLIQEVMVETGMEIYANFLKTLEGDVLKLFSKIITTTDDGNTLGVDQEMLQRHAMIVMQGIGTAVELIEDVDALDSFLQLMGEKHLNMKVKPHMLERLWPAIDYSFRGVLSDVYEKEVRNAWKTFFDYMVYKMREAMLNAKKRHVEEKKEIIFTPRSTENGTPRTNTNGHVPNSSS